MSIVKCLVVSDLHFGNPRIDSERLLQKFRKYVIPLVKEADVLLFSGDVWDMSLNMSSISSVKMRTFLSEIHQLTEEYDISVRILDGTKTHDRDQNKHFLEPYNPKIRLFSSIDIEILEPSKLSILYIPDDIPGDHMEQAVEKMHQMHLSHVDLVVHHGYFEHLMPRKVPVLPPHTLTETCVNRKLKPLAVINGHVHRSSIYKNIVSIGSFERFAHGEEEEKGFFFITIDTEKRTVTYKFHCNEDATPFITVDLKGITSTDDAIALIQQKIVPEIEKVTPLQQLFYLRILTDDPLMSEVVSKWIFTHYKNVIIAKETSSKREQLLLNKIEELDNLPQITKANLGELIVQRAKNNSSSITLQRVQSILDQLDPTYVIPSVNTTKDTTEQEE